MVRIPTPPADAPACAPRAPRPPVPQISVRLDAVADIEALDGRSLDTLAASIDDQRRAYDASRRAGRSRYLQYVRQLAPPADSVPPPPVSSFDPVPRLHLSARDLER